MSFKYKVCQMQFGRITFVNGTWNGKIDYQSDDTEAAINSCPNDYEFLEEQGSDGWELVSVVSLTDIEKLYLKKKNSKPF
ncbi:hypothetical protein KKF34_18950 [Myxococcota bacterium]|nr:hypothetical protein [Myxococcota bacterium]MBU1379532.1 hypothetical protein [Myxococcota bacterium]MBU1498966.1 hypothetical protein [Myxococcota bacterium]